MIYSLFFSNPYPLPPLSYLYFAEPTLCVLICTPGQAKACGKDATCQPIQGVGLCTYPFNKF